MNGNARARTHHGFSGAGRTTLAPILNAVVKNAGAQRANCSENLKSTARTRPSRMLDGIDPCTVCTYQLRYAKSWFPRYRKLEVADE